MMPTQRKYQRKAMSENEIRVVIIQEAISVLLSGKLIDLSFQGLAVALDTDLDLTGQAIQISFPEHLSDLALAGKVVSHEKGAQGVVRIFLSSLSQSDLMKLLRLYYPNAGSFQLETISRELSKRIFLDT
jgi:hypothetical protein